MGMIPEAVDHILVHLIEHDYLNEERYAKSFARGKFNIKKWGRVRIVNELKQREISKYNIQIALKEIREEDYVSALDSLAKKRLMGLKETNILKRRKKLADYLLYRGWESHLVYAKISELIP
jgi:regulatory protein